MNSCFSGLHGIWRLRQKLSNICLRQRDRNIARGPFPLRGLPNGTGWPRANRGTVQVPFTGCIFMVRQQAASAAERSTHAGNARAVGNESKCRMWLPVCAQRPAGYHGEALEPELAQYVQTDFLAFLRFHDDTVCAEHLLQCGQVFGLHLAPFLLHQWALHATRLAHLHQERTALGSLMMQKGSRRYASRPFIIQYITLHGPSPTARAYSSLLSVLNTESRKSLAPSPFPAARAYSSCFQAFCLF